MEWKNRYPYNLLTDYVIESNGINEKSEYEIFDIPAIELFCPERFDLLAKWIYIDAKEKNAGIEWATKIYKDSIDAFSGGKYREPGTLEKNSFQKYLDTFNALIDDIKNSGVDSTKSLVPVGDNNVLVDGAHRVAAAAYYGKNVKVIKFPGLTRNMNYNYFRNWLMEETNMAHMARVYSHIKKNCYMACLWPKGETNKQKYAIEELEKIGKIIYTGDVYLTYNGMKNFMVQIYGEQIWTGSIEDGFKGCESKVIACFRKNTPVKTILFEAYNFSDVLETKARIREIYEIGNHSVHISDSQTETEMMSELLYNETAVRFLNNAKPYKYKHVFGELPKLKRLILQNGYNSESFVVDSGSVLELYGIREAEDIDYITDIPFKAEIIDNVDRHDSQIGYYDLSVREMLYNPEKYFVYCGMKLLDANEVLGMKRTRAERKDRKDIELSKKFFSSCEKVPLEYRASTKCTVLNYMKKEHMYGKTPLTYKEYIIERAKKILQKVWKVTHVFRGDSWINWFRGKIIRHYKERLKNKEFTLIASNCNGGVVCSDLGVRFNSPFVNLFLKASDYIKLLQNFDYYMAKELEFTEEVDEIYGKVDYPVAYLDDVKIYFMHYSSRQEAEKLWNNRKQRINSKNLFVIMTDRSGCTQNDLEAFDRLPYKNKVVFTHVPHPEIKSSFYIRGYENEDKVGILSEYRNHHSIRRVLYQFDFVKWFNEGV